MMMIDTDLNVDQSMKVVEHTFSDKKTSYYFDADFSDLAKILKKENTVLITDANIYATHKVKFDGWRTIVIQPGEATKQQAAVDGIIEQLIGYEVDRTSYIVAI